MSPFLAFVLGLAVAAVVMFVCCKVDDYQREMTRLRDCLKISGADCREAYAKLNAANAEVTRLQRALEAEMEQCGARSREAARVLANVLAGIPAASPEWTPAEAAAIKEARELIARQQATA